MGSFHLYRGSLVLFGCQSWHSCCDVLSLCVLLLFVCFLAYSHPNLQWAGIIFWNTLLQRLGYWFFIDYFNLVFFKVFSEISILLWCVCVYYDYYYYYN